MNNLNRTLKLGTGFLFIGALAFLQSGFFNREDFWGLLLVYLAIYGVFVKLITFELRIKEILLIGLISRVVAAVFFPVLSDDVYRFFWDAMLQIDYGISPFAVLPSEVATHNPEIYELLNSKNYYSVYPPVLQVFYVVAYAISQGNIWGFQLVLGLEFTLIELLIYTFILAEFPKQKTVLSGLILCPMSIVEGVGNLHAELMLIPILAALVLSVKEQKSLVNAWWFSVLVAIKMNPAMWFFAVLKELNHKKLFVGATAILSSAFFMNWLLQPFEFLNVVTSLRLYFQAFEFNASLYYLVREISIWVKGYNVIYWVGPIMSLATLVFILVGSFWPKIPIQQKLLVIYGLFLASSTTLHPWYFMPFVALLNLNNLKWSSIVTAIAVFLSYSAYTEHGVYENYWVIALEYALIVASILIESRVLRMGPPKMK